MALLEVQYVDVGGNRICYAEQGEGSVLLLLHGFPETLQGWRRNIGPFSERCRVLAPDIVGFGRSAKVSYDFSCRGLAVFVRDFLDALEVERVSVVGGDTGALIALAFAALFPRRTERLVFFSGTAYPQGISALDVRMMMLPVVGELALLLGGRIGLKRGILRGFHKREAVDGEVLAEYLDCLRGIQERRLALELMRRLGDGADEVMEVLRAAPPQTLIMWAEHECYFHSWVPEKLQRDLEGSELMRVADCGHFIQEEEPEIFNAEVLRFLEHGAAA